VTAAIAVEHTFETGHRLPHIEGKCQSLHGHSWRVRVWVAAPQLDTNGMVVEFGPFKHRLREWIDRFLDHGLMLGWRDPLAEILTEHGKLYMFTDREGGWPTVENVAALLGRVAGDILAETPHAPGAFVDQVKVSETSVNSALWIGEGL
jgi:6-pyruvoyltetrahydropterin/6-carboxytetrahydropterin synthase